MGNACAGTLTLLGNDFSGQCLDGGNAHSDFLYIAVVQDIYCVVHLSVILELSFDHSPLSVHVDKHQNFWWAIEWEGFSPAFCHLWPVWVPLYNVLQVDEAVALFDMAVIPSLASHSCYWIFYEDTLLASVRNQQQTHDLTNKAVFNGAAVKLRHYMQSLHRHCWVLTVAEMDRPTENWNVWHIPSALVGKHRLTSITALTRPGSQILNCPEVNAKFWSVASSNSLLLTLPEACALQTLSSKR